MRYSRLPPPGYAVAGIAVIAAVMSVHTGMRPWQKGVWFLLIGAFLATELRAISKDRIDSAAQFATDRQKQDEAFQGVRSAQDKDLSVSVGSFTTAIAGIQSTLKAANKTLLQTQPHAAIRLDRLEFAGTPPATLKPDMEYNFNLSYVNAGTVAATDLKILGKIYPATADDLGAQKELERQFEDAWRTDANLTAAPMIPSSPLFSTIPRTFSAEELEHSGPTWTFYALIRFEYSDETGRWRTDACQAFQRESSGTIDTNLTHPCGTFQRFRYPVAKKKK